ncbi:glycosyltransferase family 2 protein [Nitrosospira multiformis]|uniref:Glycosyltransferase involved in cell wall bisynthesis n=1 Tax=Nitrosospira multiformis TaxID=1231 RepID=A0A1I7GBK3_9PROT|nr:glycosyltransferase family 2 protein [Nitrosospira multiformis]SFU45847.1 Glycosyltransferase involved in cell wall bisynthesis [Nitrosospira multiformis]
MCEKKPAISVCICTYRRPELLAKLLDSLARQSFSEYFEIIVVENETAGRAAEIVKRAKGHHARLNIQFAIEPRKGISFARNTAVSLACGDFIAWIDDDETASENWLTGLYAAQRINCADAIFGPVIPIFPEDSLSWPKRSKVFERPRHPTGTQIDAREARTSNALVKAGWFRTGAPPFDIRLANTGGEDTDFFFRMQSTGARFEWCDEASVFELVPLERQRVTWILERRLRGATNYWSERPTTPLRLTIRVLVGGGIFGVFGIAGVIVTPFGLHHAIKLWRRAVGGLGRIVALSGVRWNGY